MKTLADKYGFPLTLQNNQTKGYHIVMGLASNQKRTFKSSDLPSEFVQVTFSNKVSIHVQVKPC